MSNTKPDDQWSVYESNVQAYRTIFLVSQSILLVAGAVIINTEWLLFTVALLSVLQIWYIWVRAIVARTCVVDYHKFTMYKYFDKYGILIRDDANHNFEPLKEKDYAGNAKIRKIVNKGMSEKNGKPFYNIRLTRFKFDILVPLIYTVIWCAFILYGVLSLVWN